MKSHYIFKKACLLIAAMAMGLTVNAKIIYLSSLGDDGNDGLSQANAVGTLQKAFDLVETGDIIAVTGMISVAQDVMPQVAGITIVGVGTGSGFNGNNSAAFLSLYGNNLIRGIGVETYDFFFVNLTFQNGFRTAANTGGGAVMINGRLNVRFSACNFLNNQTDGTWDANGGAISAVSGTNVELYNCEFRGNKALQGGAVEIEGGGLLKIENSIFEQNTTFSKNNDISSATDGGAMRVWNSNLEIYNTLFKENKTWNAGMVGYDNPGGGGGVLRIVPRNNGFAHIVNSAIINNTSRDHGGAIMISDGSGAEFSIINTTIAGNSNGRAAGGAIFCNFKGSVNIINSTITHNFSRDTDINCPGIRFINAQSVYIANSIIEGNRTAEFDGAINGNEVLNKFCCDISFNTDNVVASNVTIKQSYVGRLFDNDNVGTLVGAIKTNNAANGNELGYLPSDVNFDIFDLDYGLKAGMVTSIVNTKRSACYPIDACFKKTGETCIAGDAQTRGRFALLDPFAGDDQFGKERNSPNCFAGAVEGFTPEDKTFDEYGNGVTEEMKDFIGVVGIYDVAADGAVAVAYYTVLGQKLDKEPASGLFIVKYSNGTTVKVLK